jgi:hypothetical protein
MQSDKSSSSSCPLVPSLAEHTFANLEQLQQENVFIVPMAPLLKTFINRQSFPRAPCSRDTLAGQDLIRQISLLFRASKAFRLGELSKKTVNGSAQPHKAAHKAFPPRSLHEHSSHLSEDGLS